LADRGPPLVVRLVLVALASAGATWFAFRFFQVEPEPVPGELRARVVAPDGDLATECMATLWKREGAKRSFGPDSTVRCDEHGYVRWFDVVAGDHALIAAGPGAAETTVEVTTTGAGVELDDVRLVAGGALGGQVVRDGAPVAGAEVRLLGGRMARTDEQGRFSIQGVPVGLTRLKSIHDHAAAEAAVEVVASERAEVVLELVGLPPRGVLGLSGTPGPDGFLVDNVVPRGPASGLVEIGDLLVAAAGQSLVGRAPDEVLDVLGHGLPGEVLELVLVRAMTEHTVTITRVDVAALAR